MADDFTRRKFAWLDQVADDPAVSASAFRLGYFIASRFINRQTGEAFPSQETLAKLVGVSSSKAVRYLIDQLVAGGHLSVIASHGRGHTNRYRLVLHSEPSVEGSDQGDGRSSEGAATLFPDMNVPSTKPGAAVDPDSFETWWLQYPKKVAKAGARKAYERILRKSEATADELMAGVMRYAAEQMDHDPRYTKHPTTWLNNGCWADEPSRPRAGAGTEGIQSQGRPTSRSWTEIAMGGLGDE